MASKFLRYQLHIELPLGSRAVPHLLNHLLEVLNNVRAHSEGNLFFKHTPGRWLTIWPSLEFLKNSLENIPDSGKARVKNFPDNTYKSLLFSLGLT